MKKRIILVIFAICLCIGLLPAGALDREQGQTPGTEDGGDPAKGVLERAVYYSPLSYTGAKSSRYLGYTTSAGGKKDFICGGLFCIAYEAGDKVKISAFDEELLFVHSLYIDRELADFGAATGDEDGNIYILWGENAGGEDSIAKSRTNLKLVKYDGATGAKLGMAEYIGGDGHHDGTRLPFGSGNASLAINGDIIAAHFGRLMFQASDRINHQSSTVVYADKNTMQPINLPLVYISHSFDQHVIATTDGGFLFSDHGDAYPRAFNLNYVTAQTSINGDRHAVADGVGAEIGNISRNSFASFHFTATQEDTGAYSGYAYNYTLAHMGGIAETDSAYVLAASSVRASNRSLPVSGGSEPRDVFVQIMKKDFWDRSIHRNSDANRFLVAGNTRVNTESGIFTNPFTDHGVIWLTSLPNGHIALSPKICAMDSDRVAVMWEVFTETDDEWGFDGFDYVATYYTIIHARTGQILKEATELPGARLPEYDRPVFYNGKITWSTTEEGAIRLSTGVSPGIVAIYSLDVDSPPQRRWLSPYDDTNDADWFFDYIRFATEEGLMNGVHPTVFDPDGPLSRAMVVAVLFRMFGSPEQVFSEEFSDVADNVWYTSAVMWACRNNIATGYGNNSFRPDDMITREQLAAMLFRYEGLVGNDLGFRVDLPEYFFDTSSISPWADEAMSWAVANGLISGVTTRALEPSGYATRAQCAAILERYMLRI